MKSRKLFILVLCAGPLLFSACATNSRPPASLDVSVVHPASSAPVAVYPQARAHDAERYAVAEDPLPIYENAKIVTVYMDAYENERGEIVFPGEKRVIRQPGRWNIDAARAPHRAYIPAENVAPVKGDDGWSVHVFPGAVRTHEDAIASEGSYPGGATTGASPFVEIAHPADIRILGVFDPAQESQARTLLRPGEVLIPDEALGFIAFPQERLTNTPVVVPGLHEKRQSVVVAPAKSATVVNDPADVLDSDPSSFEQVYDEVQ